MMPDKLRLNLLESRRGRKLLFTALYLSEGAPIGYIWWALPTMLRSAGVPVDRITVTTASLTLVWAMKFLWAPLVDVVRSNRWGLRHWIMLTQTCMGLALLPLIVTPFDGRLGLLTTILFIHAFFASTQDASVDALCIASTAGEERGGINGWMQLGMLLGRAAFGGLALYVQQWIGQRGALICLVCVIWSTTLLVRFMTREPPLDPAPDGQQSGVRDLTARLRSAFGRPVTWFAVGFALLGGAAFEAAGAVAGPMLIDCGLAPERVGLFFALPVVLGTGLGALAGGTISDRLGHTRAVAWLTGALAMVVAAVAGAYAGLATFGVPTMIALLSMLYVLFGAFSVSSYAMFMDLTDPRLGATQFSAFMGATNLCEVWATFAVGKLIVQSGYGPALWTFAAVSSASVLLLRGIRATRVVPA